MERRLPLFLVLSAVFLTGCPPFDDEEVRPATESVVSQLTGDLSAVIWNDPSGVEGLEVYVDRSLTMRPYLSEEPTLYRRLIGSLADMYAGDVEFYGFGYPVGVSVQEVSLIGRTQLLSATVYDRVNNDYASLFERFRADPESPKLVVTDGVQSDRETSAQFGPIVEAVNRWLEAGGDFAVLLYRTPYQGAYYSETGGGVVEYDCENRPLVVFAFLPSSVALGDVLSPLGDGLEPDYAIEFGQQGLPLAPQERSAPSEDARRGNSVLRDVAPVVLQGYDQVYQARVVSNAEDKDGFLPLEFVTPVPDERPWSLLSGRDLDTVLSGLKPRLRVWSFGAGRDTLVAEEVENPFVDHNRVGVEVESDTSGTRLRVRIPVQRPDAEGRRFAFALSLSPGPEAAYAMVPSGMTTVDDSSPSECSRTLNLGPLVGTVLRDAFVAGRSVVLAEWRAP